MSTQPGSGFSMMELSEERRFRLLVDAIVDYAIYLLTPDGCVSSWNAGAQRIKGYLPAEIIGQHFSRFYTLEDQAAGLPSSALDKAATDGKFEGEGWRVRKDGTRFWASVVIDAIRDDAGNLLGFAKVTRDITERKAAQEALQESEQRFRLLVQGVTDYAIYMLSPAGEITNWNAGAQRITGYTADEVVGTHFSRFYTEEERARGLPMAGLATAAEKGRYAHEGWRVRKDGTTFLAQVVIEAIHDDRGSLIGYAKITRDITERRAAAQALKEATTALHHAQKLESIGKLTGGVAHDFNNILQVIGGNLQLLSAYVGNNERAAKRVEAALGAVDRGARLSAQLLAFARRQPLQPAVINPAGLIRGMDDLLRRSLGETIHVETVIAAGLWNTLIDRHQLENVILNLAINARDAMPGGGTLTIEAGNSMLDDDYAASCFDVPAGQYVMIAVSDTGTGMTPEVLEQACEPFFTTKAEGEGTGLGLSMAYGFVKQSGGHFRIYSEVGHGTTVKMYFPRSFEEEAQVRSSSHGPVAKGTGTILVVEDDIAVQTTVVDMLNSFGYTVLKADDAESALVILKSGVQIDLLFSDVVMPGKLRSPDLAQQAQSLIPGIKVLFTSGYTQNAIVHGGRLDPGVHLLSKPYRREQLARKVSDLLADRQNAPAKQQSPRSAADAGAASSMPARRILVVEDDADCRQMACDLLAMLGNTAQGAATAEEAITLLSEVPFDVLFTDVGLPGMDGFSLAGKAKANQPALKIIVASGYGELPDHKPAFSFIALPKPYAMTELKKALEQADA
jgi:PAS domain S-box-containing protein